MAKRDDGSDESDLLQGPLPAVVESVCRALRQRTGRDFTQYRPATVCRRLHRRMQALHMQSAEAYVARLERDPAEPELLVQELLIGVSQFFRNPDACDCLVSNALPRLCDAGHRDGPIRIWIPGCASGEEAYTLGMLVHDYLTANHIERTCQIFATDIDAEALAEARRAVYSRASLEGVSDERLARYFIAEGDAFRVKPMLREMCTFSVQDLLRDPPFSVLDLISCRNVLIYLQPQAQNRVLELFHYALRSGGFLFLGSSEGLAGCGDLWEVVDKHHRLYMRRDVPGRPVVRVQASARNGRDVPANDSSPPTANASDGMAEAFARLLVDEYAPASVVVNRRGDIVLMAGRIGRYSHRGFAAPTHNLLDQTHGLLRRELRTVLARSAAEHRRVVRDDVRVETDEGVARLRISARPMAGPVRDLYAVVLQELDKPSPDGEDADHASEPELVEQLERELRELREELQSTVEELEASNEDLKSSNEELQSANEELQSSQEELHSVNQELEDVNAQLEANVQELRAANDDLTNLFLNAEVAILFVDRDLRITRFTPNAAAILRLRDGDLGRAITDLAPRFSGFDLVADAQQALVTGISVQREAQSVRDGTHYLIRCSAYRTDSPSMGGAVIAMTDITALKRAQTEMARIASFPERDPNPVIEVDVAGRISYANPSSLAVFPDLLVRGPLHPWLRDIESIARTFADGMERTLSRELDIGESCFQQTMYFLPDLRVIRIYGLDITSRRRAELDLQRERDYLDRVMTTSPLGIMTLDRNGIVTRANPRALEILGAADSVELQRVLETEPWRVTDHEGNPVTEDLLGFRPVEQQRRLVADVLHSFIRPDGKRVYLSINAAPISGPGHDFEGAVVSVQDTSGAYLARRALQASEQKYRQLFENLTVGFGLHELIYDEKGHAVDYRFIELNPAFERLTGLSRATALGKTVRQLLPDIEQHWIDAYARVVESGQPLSYENFSKSLGRHFDVWAFRTDSRHFATIFTDVSARKKAEEVLLQKEKLDTVGVLAGGIAHDFNNLLTGLFGYVELAHAGAPEGSDVREHLEGALGVYQRSRALAQQLLTFSKGGRPIREVADLRPVVRDAVTFALSGSNVSATFELADNLWPCAVDAQQIAQAIDNIVINARQAMPDGGVIVVEASNRDASTEPGQAGGNRREVRLAIRDTGPGISAENLPRIFDPFFSTKSTGSGLGLATAYSIIQKHEGRIEVSSELGAGSTFHIFLPASSFPPSPTAPMSGKHRAAKTGRILVMDDEKEVLAVLSAVLERIGHTATCATTGEEAIALYESAMKRGEPFDVVILDLTVRGGMGGRETIGKLRALDGRVKAIVSSGYAEDPVLSDLSAFGFRARLPKPSTLHDVKEIVDEVMAADEEPSPEDG